VKAYSAEETAVIEYEATHQKPSCFYDEFERKSETRHQTHYCPGCGHGVAHKLIAEAISDLGVQTETMMVAPVGCSVFTFYYFDMGHVQAAHGRAPAVATGLKRANPDKIVIAYQGDGDLAAIGTAEILHAANRGEKIAVFFVNNAIYGMTGGQLAPTTLVGQVSTTSPFGRRPENDGMPLHVCELLAQLDMPVYIERVALSDGKNIMRARKAVRKALELQKQQAGFTLVEILSPCPTIWKKDPIKAREFVAQQMIPVFPLGVYRDRKHEISSVPPPPQRSVAEVLGIGAKALPKPVKNGHPRQAKAMSLKMAGFGGQGVMLLGQFMAEMAMREGMEVSWLPSYGPEMRGGHAHCHVCFSKERIGSPLVNRPDVLIAMNEPSLHKFAPQVVNGGLVIYNGSALPEGVTVPQGRVLCVPAAEIADLIGTAKVANLVMLGAFCAETDCLPAETALDVIEDTVKNGKWLDMDRRALQAGIDYVRQKVSDRAPMTQPDGFAY
jgi:2-oxoisovalerate ferredoxin oxidoreductase beta subunit